MNSGNKYESLNLVDWAKERFRIHPEGWRFAGVVTVVAVLCWFVWAPLGFILLGLAIAVAGFFRDPVRYVLEDSDIAVAPADGTILSISVSRPPPELALPDSDHLHIATFLSVLDVHINRTPRAGKILDSHYESGAFLSANHPDAHRKNERLALTLIDTFDERFAVVQIAGAIAKRIVRWPRDGQQLEMGERYGLIRFGSRVDIWLPPHYDATVGVGQRTIGGETIMARRREQSGESKDSQQSSENVSAVPYVNRI